VVGKIECLFEGKKEGKGSKEEERKEAQKSLKGEGRKEATQHASRYCGRRHYVGCVFDGVCLFATESVRVYLFVTNEIQWVGVATEKNRGICFYNGHRNG
jgi:hypothetical protein